MKKMTVEAETVIDRLQWRYAAKKYRTDRQISAADWHTLEDAILLAPSSFGLQPYRFLVIDDKDLRQRLHDASPQSPIIEASHFIVITHATSLTNADVELFIERAAHVRGQTRESLADYEQIIKSFAARLRETGAVPAWTARQAYIALGFLLETAALLGIDATPMEGFDPQKFNEILELDGYSSVALAALGYRDAENDWLAPLVKVRMPKEDVIVHM